ncbi:MAG: amidase [Dongiaceae bacterium]
MQGDLCLSTIADLGAAFRNQSLSPVEVTQLCLDRIAKLDSTLNAFVSVQQAEAIVQAENAERELAGSHDRGPLHGVPVAIKDLIDVAGVPTTFASRAGSPHMASSDATLVRNLRQAGAVILGKTNLLEYAYGAVHPDFGQTNNPWDPHRTSGGSSGGSAAAVAAGLCFGAVGTDTGGSIRIPAAYCGAVGLKPSYGKVSLDGVQSLSPTLDHAGPLARTCADAALMLGGMTGESLDGAPRQLEGLRIGLMHHPGAERFLEPAVATLFEHAVRAFRDAGAILHEVRLDSLALASDAAVKIVEPEASLIHRDLLRREPGGFSAITRAQLEAGFAISAVEYLDALRLRAELREQFSCLFESVDAIISPAVPWVAPAEDPPIGGESGAGEMLYSAVYNLVGLPALVIPCGLSAERLPCGLQIVTAWERDDLVLSIGAAIEQRLSFPAVPPLRGA